MNEKSFRINSSKFVLKPDSPIIGKNGVFLIEKKKISKKLLMISKKNSHNNKVFITDYINGSDISIFLNVKKGKKKIVKVLAIYEEIVELVKNKFVGRGIVYPAKKINNRLRKNFYNLSKKIINKFTDFHGIISISFKLTNSGKIYPYEINIGLSGDGFADRLFPLISPKLSLYDIETNNIYFNRFLNPKIYRNKYVSYLNNRLIIGKKNYKKHL